MRYTEITPWRMLWNPGAERCTYPAPVLQSLFALCWNLRNPDQPRLWRRRWDACLCADGRMDDPVRLMEGGHERPMVIPPWLEWTEQLLRRSLSYFTTGGAGAGP